MVILEVVKHRSTFDGACIHESVELWRSITGQLSLLHATLFLPASRDTNPIPSITRLLQDYY